MRTRGLSRSTIAIALAAALTLGALGVVTSNVRAHSSALQTDDASTIAVTASPGFAFNPNLFGNVAMGQSIIVTLTNGDDQTHTFTIASRQGWVIPTSYTEGQLTAFFQQYPPLFNMQAVAASSNSTNFTSPASPGWYEFVCTEPGHFQSGMYGFIAFGEALPTNLTVSATNDGPGAAVFIIVGTIVTLTVIAIVLGFVVGKRRGSTEEMPPERLGYPEPLVPSEPAPPPGAPPKSP
jgi:plastocyanin